MVFYIVDFAIFVDPFKSVRAVSVQMSVAVRGASIRKEDCYLMESLRRVLPKSKHSIWILHVSSRASLLSMYKVRKLDWIINEEHWRVVSHEVIISFFGVKLDSKASGISDGVWSASFSGNS